MLAFVCFDYRDDDKGYMYNNKDGEYKKAYKGKSQDPRNDPVNGH